MIYGLEEKELKLIVADYANSNDKLTPSKLEDFISNEFTNTYKNM